MLSEEGQSLLELIVVISVIIFVVGALTFATIASLRSANFAQNQSQATKLAQEALELVRTGRDRNSQINFGSSQTTWRDPILWSGNITIYCGITPCYFKLQNGTNLLQVGNGDTFNFNFAEQIPPTNPVFQRAIIIADDSSFAIQKTITTIVIWKDFAGSHESRLTTILRKL